MAALTAAHARGVKVWVIADRSQERERYSLVPLLRQAGVPLYIDAAHAIAHNKIIVIDGHTTIGGSFNLTQNAENNSAENVIIIRDSGLAGLYTANWQSHLKHSTQVN